MLNRRILRIKAMQALYSYYLAENSLKAVIQENLEKEFTIDPAKDDFLQAPEFEKRKRSAINLYLKRLGKESPDTKDLEKEIVDAVNKAQEDYYSALRDESVSINKRMFSDINDIHNMYFKLLLLPIAFTTIEKAEKEKKEKAHIQRFSTWNFNFIDNPVIKALNAYPDFQKEVRNRKVDWSKEEDTLRGWFKDVLQKNERLIEYQGSKSPTDEEHLDAVVYLMKKIVFKDEIISDYLGSIDLRWNENKPVLSSLVVKTLQGFNKDDAENPFELKTISKNEKDDLIFFKKLYEESVKNNDHLEEVISEKTRNWDISRVALLDKIILKMALVEMTNFPSIPVKVTINEFIEISKLYSTPKSKQFVNGILDVLANELTSDGVIKKSGRGLIDNK
ncbi:MAG: transcription antitermination factor NusB [Bacteroidota bacterium]